ncbi:HisA/HisF-related TIM barrel protein [Xanthomonas citri pv. fuscans]|uniref:HisA/HisF-related TIM barrel protein n=1 Tax=Xanthomonas citri TaxID=346 RepID=UPI002226FFF1|nr:HisA/HisF-related TIM barrel protein [Xanthomonas citri]UZB06023.1 HisA/HisF-related TIM barrel protein [Xanthomonas citri pv. fuscans]
MVIGWLQEFGADRLTIALDTRQDANGVWQLPVHGWTEAADATLDQLADAPTAQSRAAGICCVPTIARDGMLSGPNMARTAHLQRADAAEVARCRSPEGRAIWPLFAADHGRRRRRHRCLGKALLEGASESRRGHWHA